MPNNYVVHRTIGAIDIDGKGTDSSWQKAFWTSYFVDIEGDKKPRPELETRVKMLWDTTYFYFYAELEEPHVWAKLEKRDAVIFHDNDFEIFIDPDGDTHHYMEFEVNALNTVWDLFLSKPYRDGGQAINSWNIVGLKSAVHIDGTLNEPSDTDKGWSVEVAIPWKVIREITKAPSPPKNGNRWRLNFSRVQWKTDVIDGKYVKKKDSEGKNLEEDNWVWSPQREIAMHEPEFWGIVSFSSKEVGTAKISMGKVLQTEEIRQMLFGVHRAQRMHWRSFRTYASDINKLYIEWPSTTTINQANIELKTSAHEQKYEISYYIENRGWWVVDETGKLQFVRQLKR